MAKSTTRYAALPFRRSHGRWEVLLVTTRRSGRWIVPKGRPIKGCTPARTAKIEAFEEAGVSGAIARKSIGAFEMKSRFAGPKTKASRIEVFPLAVRRQHESWVEHGGALAPVDDDRSGDQDCSSRRALASCLPPSARTQPSAF